MSYENIITKELLEIILLNKENTIISFNIEENYIYYYKKEQIWDDMSKYFKYIESDEEYKINIFEFIDKCEKWILFKNYCISMLISDDCVCSEIYNHNMIDGILFENCKDTKLESIIDCINWIIKNDSY